jgi:hypothetical protein
MLDSSDPASTRDTRNVGPQRAIRRVEQGSQRAAPAKPLQDMVFAENTTQAHPQTVSVNLR